MLILELPGKILTALTAYWNSQAAKANQEAAKIQYDLMSVYRKEKELADEANDDFEAEYNRLLAAGQPDLARRLQKRAVRTRLFSGWLRDFAARQGLPHGEAAEPAQPGSDAREGRSDLRPDPGQ
jgi:hypothetical protein